jgi:hypothetical protein
MAGQSSRNRLLVDASSVNRSQFVPAGCILAVSIPGMHESIFDRLCSLVPLVIGRIGLRRRWVWPGRTGGILLGLYVRIKMVKRLVRSRGTREEKEPEDKERDKERSDDGKTVMEARWHAKGVGGWTPLAIPPSRPAG